MSGVEDLQYGDDLGWRRHLREYVNHVLARMPSAYLWVQNQRAAPNPEKTLFITILHDGDNVVDVGANRGWFTVLFSHLVGRRGQVHAFEPVPGTYAILSRSVSTFCVYGNVILNRVALGDSVGTVEMNVPGDDDGQASMRIHADFGAWTAGRHLAVAAPLSTLDAYLEDKDQTLSAIRLIKCDIEGAERLFLRGASRTIRRYAPIVHVEICHELTKAFGYVPTDIVRDLANLGYDCWFATGDIGPTWIDADRLFSVPDPPKYVNLTCFSTAVHRAVVRRLKTSRFGRRVG